MKYLKYIVGVLLIIVNVKCNDKLIISPDQAEHFVKFYGSTGTDQGEDILQTEDEGYLILGNLTTTDYAKQIVLIKIDKYGKQEWNKQYGNDLDDVGNKIIISPDNGYAIIGTTFIPGDSSKISLIKISSTGQKQWNKYYEFAKNTTGTSVISNDIGGYTILGYTESEDTVNSSVILIKTNENGTAQDTGKTGLNFDNKAYSIINSQGILFLSGEVSNKFSVFRNFKNVGHSYLSYSYSNLVSVAEDICITPDNNLYVVGTSLFEGNNDVFLIKIDNELELIWEKHFGGDGNETGKAICLTSNNEIAIVGTTESSGSIDKDIYLVKTDADGNELFTKHFGEKENEYAEQIISTKDGGFAICGTLETENNSMICVIKTDSNGNIDK